MNEISSGAKKLFAKLPVSVSGDVFTDAVVQVNPVATRNTIPYEVYCKLGTAHNLQKSTSTLVTSTTAASASNHEARQNYPTNQEKALTHLTLKLWICLGRC